MTSTPEAEPTSETAEASESAPESVAAPEPIDEQEARRSALAALHEITPATTVGEPRDSAVDADGVLTIRFENRMPGYPGWVLDGGARTGRRRRFRLCWKPS